MIGNKTVLVTICCRGGSKGIPNKGLKVLGGKPLLQWTLDLLPQIKYVDMVVFSSDSREYCNYVYEHTKEVRIRPRPAELATDTISRVEAIKDAVSSEFAFRNKEYDIIVDLGVATPFKTAQDVNESIELLLNMRNCGHIFTVTEPHRNPYFSIVEEDGYGGIWLCKGDGSFTSRQTSPRVYDMNDAVNVWWRATLFHEPHFPIAAGDREYHMPPERSLHLDSPRDWAFAEFLLEKKYIPLH